MYNEKTLKDETGKLFGRHLWMLERIEKKVEALPVEGTSPIVENRIISPEGLRN